MTTKYNVLSQVGGDRLVAVRRLTDGLVSRCKPTWLRLLRDDIYEPSSKTKAIRLDGLEWTTEG